MADESKYVLSWIPIPVEFTEYIPITTPGSFVAAVNITPENIVTQIVRHLRLTVANYDGIIRSIEINPSVLLIFERTVSITNASVDLIAIDSNESSNSVHFQRSGSILKGIQCLTIKPKAIVHHEYVEDIVPPSLDTLTAAMDLITMNAIDYDGSRDGIDYFTINDHFMNLSLSHSNPAGLPTKTINSIKERQRAMQTPVGARYEVDLQTLGRVITSSMAVMVSSDESGTSYETKRRSSRKSRQQLELQQIMQLTRRKPASVGILLVEANREDLSTIVRNLQTSQSQSEDYTIQLDQLNISSGLAYVPSAITQKCESCIVTIRMMIWMRLAHAPSESMSQYLKHRC